MPDREKVFKGLNCCAHTDGTDCPYCPYNIADEDCTALMSMDVLDLLKEQETEDIGRGILFLCKTCGYGFDDIFVNDESKYPLVPRYCPNCGRKVKRDDI